MNTTTHYPPPSRHAWINKMSEYTRLTADDLILRGANPVFFALHDHHILPHRFPEAERVRRDHVLLLRGFGAAKIGERT